MFVFQMFFFQMFFSFNLWLVVVGVTGGVVIIVVVGVVVNVVVDVDDGGEDIVFYRKIRNV